MTSSAGTVDRLWPRVAALARRSRYAVAALDQVALSLFGFALNLVLVRALSATDFGIVSLWLSVSALTIGVQNALVNGPLSVYPPAARDPAAAGRLETALTLVNLLTIAVTALAVALVNIASDAEWARHDLVTALAIPLFTAFNLYREYHRSVAYSRHDMAMLLWIDLPYLAATSLCLVGMLAWPERFGSLAGAFLARTVGGVISQRCLQRRRQEPGRRLFARGTLTPYRAISGEVSWSLVGVFANHVETRSYAYISTTMVGLVALAAINIVGVLFRPIMVLASAWSKTALPQLSAMLGRGETAAFGRLLAGALTATAIGSAAWYFVLLACWEPVERLVLAGKYPEAQQLLLPWAAASAASVLRYVAGMGLVAARQFKFLAHVQIVCGALSAAATVLMILWQGYVGAMWGIALGNGACLLMILARLRQARRPGFLEF
jgi:O-antigen/teichoic acid export membrane protein